MPRKNLDTAERVGVRSATKVETPDEGKRRVVPGVEEGDCCCVCGSTEDLVYGVDESDPVAELKSPTTPELIADIGKCCVCGSTDTVQRCGGCRATHYCSKKCQKSHRSYHGPYCNAIKQLVRFKKERRKTIFVSR